MARPGIGQAAHVGRAVGALVGHDGDRATGGHGGHAGDVGGTHRLLEELEHDTRTGEPFEHLERLAGGPGLVGVDAHGHSAGYGPGDGPNPFDVERHRPAQLELQGAEPLFGAPAPLGGHFGRGGQADRHVGGDRALGGPEEL